MTPCTPATPPRAPDIHLQGVSRHWGAQAVLSNVTLRVGAGERVALIGPSGAGKSTLIRLMAGALRATAGQVVVDGHDMARFSWRQLQAHRARCRTVEQQHGLVLPSTVHQNVVSGLLSGWSWHRMLLASVLPLEVARVGTLLQSLGMAPHQWDTAGDLSGGQMQRVAIARALVADPTLLLADEPTSSLDPATARAVTQLMVAQARLRGMSLVFCTHVFEVVRQDCTRVVALRQGEVLFDGPPDAVTDALLTQLYEGSDERA